MKRISSIISKLSECIIEIILCILIMFYYKFEKNIANALFVFSIVFLLIKNRFKILFKASDSLWLIYISIMFSFGIFRDNDKISLINGTLFLLLCLVIKLIMQKKKYNNGKIMFKTLFFFGLIHSIAVIIETINPLAVREVRNFLNIENMAELGRIVATRAGITNQSGVAGYCICIFICIALYYMFSAKKSSKIKYLIIFSLGIIALALTGKRTFAIGTFFCIFTVLYIYYSVILNKTTKFIGFTLVSIIIIAITIQIPFFYSSFERFINGGFAKRDIIYSLLIKNINKNPFIGVGSEAFSNYSKYGAHNEYLRVLSENGMLGFIFFILALLVPLFYILKTIINYREALRSSIQNGKKENLLIMLSSVYWQFITLLYSLTGNPLTTKEQLITYFIFTAIGLGAAHRVKILNNYKIHGLKIY